MNQQDYRASKMQLCHSLFDNNWLDDGGILLARPISERNIAGVRNLYTEAYRRGDWFGSALNITSELDIRESTIQNHLSSESSMGVVFEDNSGNILGVTGLFFDEVDGVLIDETQIDPILGRRKGLMTRYFRYVVPLLVQQGRFWTEFVLTPESAVLRRVLVSELAMQVTGLKPNCYRGHIGPERSVLVAYGPAAQPRQLICELTKHPRLEISRFARACVATDTEDPPSSEMLGQRSFVEAEEISISLTDTEALSAALDDGLMPVSINPFKQMLTLSDKRWGTIADREILISEDLAPLTSLIFLQS